MARWLWAKSAFNRAVDRFLPPGYSVEHAASLGRARILVALLLYNACLSVGIIALALYAPSNTGFNAMLAVGFSTVTLASYLLCLLLFHRTGSILLTGHAFASCMFLTIVIAAAITGGFESPNLQILVTIPVLVFLMAGRHAGLLWLLVVAVAEGLFYHATLRGMVFPQILAPEAAATIRLGVWILMAATVVACFLIYDVVNESLRRQLSRERGRFAHQAAHDVLTELPNRSEFYRRLESALACLDGNRRLAVAFLDLDAFKPINDRYGHHAGDEVLKIISQRLLHSVRRHDSVARLGGDEFAILFLLDSPEQDITPVLANLLARIAEPVRAGDHLVKVSGSVGVVFAPDHGRDMETLLKRADQSMYRAKAEKNRFCVFQPS